MIDEFLLQPSAYSTNGKKTLIQLLEEHWIENLTPGEGTIYILAGFGNYNGGVRFYDIFKNHIARGGKVRAIFGGSTSQRLTSKELVKALLDCGAEVSIINRKRIMHAKCFGYKKDSLQSLVVTSGNFTGPGMSQNVEAALSLTSKSIDSVGFNWDELFQSFEKQNWDIYQPHLPQDESVPEWKLLYNEVLGRSATIEEVEADTMLLTLGHADTVRINAERGTNAGRGSQYFWLSKYSFDFFPALTIPNSRGDKPTYSTIITVNYPDLGIVDEETRVTFEAGNNVDFRLGTGPLRYTKAAQEGDIAAISRKANAMYEISIIKANSPAYDELKKYQINFTGNRGKSFGYIQNDIFEAKISELDYKTAAHQ